MGRLVRFPILFTIIVLALVVISPSVALAVRTNAECAECHGSGTDLDNADFGIGTVNRNTACRTCHLDSLVNTHPYHNAGGNCGGMCHPGWGQSIPSYTPRYLTASGAFGTTGSHLTASTDLHTIHSTPRWLASATQNTSKCNSCHAPASCSACHSPIGDTHARHAQEASPALTPRPYTGTVSPGVGGSGSQADATALYNYEQWCGYSGCHDLGSLRLSAPAHLDAHQIAGDPGTGFISSLGQVFETGKWVIMKGTVYTNTVERTSNVLGAEISLKFNGAQVAIIGTKDPYRGRMEIFIDGFSQGIVDQYSPTTQYQTQVWKSGGLASTDHTVTIKPLGTKSAASRGTWVSVDHITIYPGVGTLQTPTCAGCHAFQATSAHGGFTHDLTETIRPGNLWNTGFGSYACSACHQSDAKSEHVRPTSSGSRFTISCEACHLTYAPRIWTGTYDVSNGCAFGTCHTGVRTQHGQVVPAHVATTTGESVACNSCHAGDLRAVHNNSVPGNGFVETNSCLACHSAAASAASNSCVGATGCHPNTYNAMVDHAVADAGSHNASEAGKPFTRAYQATAGLDDGGVECSVCHSSLLTLAHSATPAVSCATGGAGGNGCHADTTMNSMSTAASGWTDRKCSTCHSFGANVSHDETTTAHLVASNGCAGSEAFCHDSNSLWELHLSNQAGGPANGDSCQNVGCHVTKDSRPTVFVADSCGSTSLGGCHLDKTMAHANNFEHTFSAASYYNGTTVTGCTNQTGCHNYGAASTANFASPFHPSTGCFTGDCHLSGSKADFHLPIDCTGCHDGGFIGAPVRTSLTAAPVSGGHYSSTVHGAAGMANLVTSGGTASASCGQCHNATIGGAGTGLLNQHTNVTVAGSPYGTSLVCGECHGDSRANGSVQVAANWATDACVDCHAVGSSSQLDHATTAPVALEVGSSCGLTGSSCHNTKNLHVIHRNATGCNVTGCHNYTTQAFIPTTTSCGEGNSGCHLEKTTSNHGADHDYTSASDYNNISQAGCTNSGDGCHGADAARTDAVAAYHADGNITCTDSKCHISPTMDAAWKAGGIDAECARCHNGLFVNAVDAIGLADASPNGHYSEATHTVAGMSNTVGAGGTYAATCADCHTPAGTIDGLYNQHQGLGGGLGNTTCSDCHNKSASIQTLVTDAVRTNSCAACHTVSVLPTMVQHGAAAPALAGTEAQGLGSCQMAGCHTTLDLHVLHKSNVSGNANGCNMANCHDATKQGVKPTAKTCGTGGACHNTGSPHPSDAVKHTTVASGACAGCHENADLRIVHGNVCGTCHGNATYPTIPAGKRECGSCHNGVDVGLHVYDPAEDNHYLDPTHLSSGNGTYNGYACTQCHKLDMKTEHGKTSVAFPSYNSTTTVIGKCVGCHEVKVDTFGVVAWDKKCASCHPSTHTARAASHNASVSNAGCGGAGCHAVNDVAVIHNNSITTNSMYPSCITCHATSDSVPAPIDCDAGGCHGGMQHGHSLSLASSNWNNTTSAGCTNSGIGCHGSMPTSPTPDYAVAQYHPDNNCQSGVCHLSASQTDPAFNNPQTCQNCHGARVTSPLNFLGAPDVSPVNAADNAPAGGHYDEATHTIVSVAQTMSVGGAAQTTCVTCHQHVNPGGVDGEWYQHQVLAGYGNTTCVDCHSFVTPGDVAGTSRVGNAIRTALTNGTDVDCVDCHNALVMGVQYVMHETTSSPPATATVLSTLGFQCGDVGCHYDEALPVQLEIHELHKGDGNIIPTWEIDGVTPYNAATCQTGVCHPNYPAWLPAGTGTCDRRPEPECVDCHDPLLQGWKPDEKSCGVNGNCHITSPHSSIGPAHSVTALSQACVDCHETTDLRSNHGYTDTENCSSNNVCHNLEGTEYTYNSQTYTFTLVGKKECKDCHAVGKMPGVTRDHAPHDPNHYVGSEVTHTATLQTGTFGAIYSVVATDGFDVASWPVSWIRSNATRVRTSATTPYEGTYCAEISNTASFTGGVQPLSNVASPTVSFYYKTAGTFSAGETAKLEYTINGINFVSLWSTTTAQAAWTKVGPIAVPRSDEVQFRFSSSATADADLFRIDAFVLKPGDATGAGCFETCHYDELKPEHFKASAEATRVPSIYPDKCVDCHENRTDAFDVTNKLIDWDRTCVECHGATKHYGQTARHDATLVRPDCGGSGCHYLKDVAVIHNNSVLGNDWPAVAAQTCTVCHDSKLSTPSSLNCGDVGCHAGMQPHTHDLDYDGSLFNPTTRVGCIQSGAGCHGNSTATNYATAYHGNVGCTNGRCHRNATDTGANPSVELPEFNNPNTCMNCHGGGTLAYDGATDRIPLMGVSPDGHYPPVNHTAGAASRTATMSSGGVAAAACTDCHSDIGAGGANGLWPQHQGLPVVGDTSCVDCHNLAGTAGVVTSNWTTDTCAECHNAGVMGGGYAQHSTVAPSVTATEADGAGSCYNVAGCHGTMDLHALHKNSTLGCNLTGCHNFAAQALKPTTKSCGTAGVCHQTDPHNPLAHAIVTDTGLCRRCHEGAGNTVATDVRDVYKSNGFGTDVTAHDSCASCHNGTTNYGGQVGAVTDCTYCHVAGKVGAISPYDPTHYKVPSHDSSLTTGANYSKTLTDYHGANVSATRSCTLSCHTIDLATEHNKTSVNFPLGANADKCVACHETKVDLFAGRWAGACSVCHATSHTEWTTKHNASTQAMSTPGTTFNLGGSVTATITSENWGTGTTWPTGTFPTRTSTTYVVASSAPPAGRTGSAAYVNRGSTTAGTTSFTSASFDMSAYSNRVATFWYKTEGLTTGDYALFQYSTNGSTFTNMFANVTTNVGWVQGTFSIPAGTAFWFRFGVYGNTLTTERLYVDDFAVRGDQATGATYGASLPASSTSAASCQNNPNGTECHDVTDVANIHSKTPNFGCPLCHTSTVQHPTNLNCQNAGCHPGVNVNTHNTTWHESSIASNTTGAYAATTFTTGWCRGCHDDSIDNEHFALADYGQTPCSMCHDKVSNSTLPTVTVAAAASAIHSDTVPGNVLCEKCHTATQPTKPHSQDIGWSGTAAAVGATQFGTTWSGHRAFTAMPGSKAVFTAAVDGTAGTRTWPTPTLTSWITNWSASTETTSMPVTCADCHGDVSGLTGPHGGSMTIGMAIETSTGVAYAKNYSSGGAYLNTTAPTIMPNTAGNKPVCIKCHSTATAFYTMNTAHNRSGDHTGATLGKCVICHSKTPHAWKRPRLLGYTTDPAPYASLGLTGITDQSYTSGGWIKGNCTSTYSGCTTHGTLTGTRWP